MKTWKQSAIIGMVAVIVFVCAFTACDDGSGKTTDPNGNPTVTSITAVYTQGGRTVYTTTPLDDLKTGLTVTAHYSDSTSQTVTAYTLSGTLTAGASEITVTYAGKTAKFTVTVSGGVAPTVTSISAVYTQGGRTVYATTPLDDLKAGLTVTAHYSDSTSQSVMAYTLSGTLAVGSSTITVTYQGQTTSFTVTVTSGGGNPVTGNTLAQKLQWLNTNAQSNGTYTLEVTANEQLAPHTLSYSGKSNITVILKGTGGVRTVTLPLSDNGSLFTVGNGVTLVLDENITLRGKPDYTNNSPLVTINGALIMNNGSKITGNLGINAYTDGGGVLVDYNGIFTMNGGEISDNNAATGGGVHVAGTFTMSGGKITENLSRSDGGGVYVGRRWDTNSEAYLGTGTFTMTGGEISGNNSNSSGGGGVYLEGNQTTFTMTGGKISGNSAGYPGSGGGVFVGSYENFTGNFTMNGGEISDNTAPAGDGGGVASWGIFTMNDGKISGNTASGRVYGSGGGVYMFIDGIFTMNGGEISGNTAPVGDGGGVCFFGTFTMTDGTIANNNAVCGGGVYMGQYSTFTMADGTISSNTASNSGGGVYMTSDDNVFIMEGGEISGNTTNTESGYGNGGGVYIRAGIFSMKSGKIMGNSAIGNWGGNGGGVYVNGGTFTMTNGTISGNTAGDEGGNYGNGGGIYMCPINYSYVGTFRIVNGTVYGSDEADEESKNTAHTGAALYKEPNSVAQYGTLSKETDEWGEELDVWNGVDLPLDTTAYGNNRYTDDTIKVVEGELQP
jgi:hypothetical protein